MRCMTLSDLLFHRTAAGFTRDLDHRRGYSPSRAAFPCAANSRQTSHLRRGLCRDHGGGRAVAPQRVLHVGDPWCFDDLCLSVEHVSRTAAPAQVAYDVSLLIFSRARRVSQRANGAWVYAIDGRGNRYAPEPDTSSVSLDVLLQPGESIRTSRVFKVPAGAGELGLVTGHGPSWISNFIIGDEASLFHKRDFVRLN
jgi:hypothetical protein